MPFSSFTTLTTDIIFVTTANRLLDLRASTTSLVDLGFEADSACEALLAAYDDGVDFEAAVRLWRGLLLSLTFLLLLHVFCCQNKLKNKVNLSEEMQVPVPPGEAKKYFRVFFFSLHFA